MRNLVIGNLPQSRRSLNLGEYAEDATLVMYNQQIETNFILKRNVLFLSQNSERAGLKSIKHTL